MGKRYTKTERLGINKTENFFLEEFDWIFRDQPLVDVGVDAIVEIQENGNPTGQFLALQIKAGKSHLKNLKKEPSNYVYYTSNIHYNYWLKLNIPMLFVVYLPSKKKLYWQYILDENFEETSTQWKLKIPNNQILDLKNKEEIQKFVYQYTDKSISIFSSNLKAKSIYDFMHGIEYIGEAVNALENITKTVDKFTKKIKALRIEISKTKNYTEAQSIIKQTATLFNITSTRIKSEMFIFSESIVEGIYSYQMLSFIAIEINQPYDFTETLELALSNVKEVDSAVDGTKYFHDSILKIPNDIVGLSVKESKKNILEILSALIFRNAKCSRIMANVP